MLMKVLKPLGLLSEFGKPLENGFRVSIDGKEGSCIGEDGERLEDSEMNGVSSLLQMKGSVRNIDVNGGRSESGEGFGTLLSAVDQSKEINVENVLPDSDHDGENVNLDEKDDGGGEFSSGYFVWGKIKNHPWWPGQVYYLADASDYAVKLSTEGKTLCCVLREIGLDQIGPMLAAYLFYVNV
ncbi:hypothetical protein F3Y22_tig00113726pilonHSYRG00028 [Hibiscus syriacus]|uniref:PWWP domain-containing protein n=1 Tax=Hibiscus syriacus TaxID=106335 RepID=A0A6A2Y101_HIBSY|nr:hypothetical protein F3Y22_tig00113726pilonHSYRG00028 [Hibiscus syriacus]